MFFKKANRLNKNLLAELVEETEKLATGKIEQLTISSDQSELDKVINHINTAVKQLQHEIEDTDLRLKLVTEAIKMGLWDMSVVAGDPVNPNNEFIWSDDFRHMLGFQDETDFPNVLESWASRIHPDDYEQ